jgi:hypothetical protein
MAVHDKVNCFEFLSDHLSLDGYLELPVDQSDPEFAKVEHILGRQGSMDIGAVHVARHRLNRGNGPQLIEDGKLHDVSRMEDQFHIFENIEHRRRQGRRDCRDVGVRDYADFHALLLIK